jgi:hypothetical protein
VSARTLLYRMLHLVVSPAPQASLSSGPACYPSACLRKPRGVGRSPTSTWSAFRSQPGGRARTERGTPPLLRGFSATLGATTGCLWACTATRAVLPREHPLAEVHHELARTRLRNSCPSTSLARRIL